jgi:uncharacterized membrane protein YraQ (UPF0718 family)
MSDLLLRVIASTWDFAVEAAPFLLLGFVLAGAIQVFLRRDRLVAWIGRPGVGSVVRAAAVGVPLPLCSCGVVPVAAALRRQGADRGATTSFLISTPESGVDSIAISWALLDPVMTVFRPVAAFIAAVAGGVAQQLADKRYDRVPQATTEAVGADSGCCSSGQPACCGGGGGDSHAAHPPADGGFYARLRAGGRFAFVELFDDIGLALLAGLLLSGAIMALVPEFDLATLGAWGGLLSMLVMLVVGVPLYVCATAATPLAAVMIAKGVSPGAVLVFLMAGPATNLASLAMLSPVLGRRGLVVYVASVMVSAVALGLLLDALYPMLGIMPSVFLGADEAAHCADCHGWLSHAMAAMMIALAVAGMVRRWRSRRRQRAATGAPAPC